MPLMDDWCRDLIERFRMASLHEAAEVIGLTNQQRPEDFEARIGQFLAWQRSLPVAKSLMALGKPNTGVYQVPKDVEEWFQRSDIMATQIVNVIYDSLFSLFGHEQINQWNAGRAYGALIEQLGLARTHQLAVATTNYDVGAEIGLLAAGRRPDWGQPQHFQDAQPPLAIQGLADGWTAYRDPVLHLHGCVGWYLRDDGTLLAIDPKAKFTPSMGQPGLLLPDPNKDYSELPALNDMWAEFDKLIEAASHVLVLGHSLHDPKLVEHLKPARNLAVSVYFSEAHIAPAEEIARVNAIMPSAVVVPLAFGPEPQTQGTELARWVG
jgi:hypothetical protein